MDDATWRQREPMADQAGEEFERIASFVAGRSYQHIVG